MKAVQFSEYGEPDVLQVVDVDEPHPGPGQIRIAVRTSGVNALDWKLRSGAFKDFMPVTFPSGVGLEAAGIVDEIGLGVSDVSVGDAVFGLGVDTAAEHCVLNSWGRKPDAMSFEEAGGLAVAVETTGRALDRIVAKSGETLLVSGASGGVGTVLVQFARDRGMTVIGTASQSNHDYPRELGVLPTTYGDGLADRVKALAPEGVNAAIDVAGSGIIPELIDIVGNPVQVLSIADFSAPQHGAQFTPDPRADAKRDFAQAAELYEAGELQLHVAKAFPLAQTTSPSA